MKKMLVILIVSCLLLVSGCGSAPGEDIDSRSTDESVEIGKGLLDVTITLPASLVEEDNIEATIKEAKEKGVKEAVLNDDGSLTYKMSKSVYRELKQELKDKLRPPGKLRQFFEPTQQPLLPLLTYHIPPMIWITRRPTTGLSGKKLVISNKVRP